jgi:hypothetical protein
MAGEAIAGAMIDYLLIQEDKSAKITSLLLASDCLSEVRNRASIKATAVAVLEQLKKTVTIHNLDPDFYLKGLNAIASIWKEAPETLPWLKSYIQLSQNSPAPEAAIQVIAEGWKEDSETLSLAQALCPA